jgi:riboflavin transporter FmnP
MRLVIEILVALIASTSMFFLLGAGFYVPIGIAFAIIAFAIFVLFDRNHEALSEVAKDFVFSFLLALVLGAIWPTIPLIIGIGATKRAGGEREPRKESERP